MEKRIFAAVLISFAFLWLWSAVAPKVFPELAQKPKPAVTSTTSTTAASAPTPTTATTASPAAPKVAAGKPATGSPVATPVATAAPVSATRVIYTDVDTDDFIARFSNRGAQLISLKLKQHLTHDHDLVDVVKARPADRTDFPFAIETGDAKLTQRLNTALYDVRYSKDGSEQTVDFRYVGADGVSATKSFKFDQHEYLFHWSAALSPAVQYRVAIGPGIRTLDKEEKDSQFNVLGSGVVQREDSLKVINREKSDRVNIFPAVQYVGIEDNYFLSALRPEKSNGAVIRAAEFKDKNVTRRELYAAVNAAPDGTVSGTAFFGPKQTQILDRYGFEKTLAFGYFGLIGRFLLTVLVWINKYTHNYGWAIVVLTIVIKAVLWPLQHKGMTSMKKMQKLQPKVEQIKARYKKARTDPEQRQKMNTEVMKLYNAEGVNPMGGCLPMLLQLPILWGFYGLLSRAIELRGAPWILWIHDLSTKDPYYITPILMTLTMFVQQMVTPTTADPTQRRTFMIMPFIFGFIFKEFPSGLVLYWLVQNILTIVQQLIMNRYWKEHPDEVQTTADLRKA